MLLQKIGATNLTLADAIAEIVANSFDAAIEGSPAIIDVNVSADEISVIDSGTGMTEDILAEAIRLGVDMSSVVKKRVGAKGHFGLGMKTACASIGKWWAVHTRPTGGNLEYRVAFDLEDWERRPNSPEAWSITIDDMPRSSDSPLGDRTSGTAVIVQRLRQRNPLPGPVLAKLGEAFKAHLEQGDSIVINGDPALPKQYRFVPGSKVPIDIQFGPNSSLRITGWVALDTQTHNDGNYGFNIYRHNQLVQTWNKDWFAAHLMTSRLIGEVHMDFIDATFFKMGLQQSEEWRFATAEMKEFLKPVTKASQGLSKQKNIHNPIVSRDIIGEMRSSVGAEEWVPPTTIPVAGELGGGVVMENPPPTPERELPKLRVSFEALVLEDGARIPITIAEKAMSSTATPFDLIFDDFREVPELQAVVNTNHELWSQSKDRPQLRMLAVGDAILRYLMQTAGMSGNQAAEARNEWILAAMKEGWK